MSGKAQQHDQPLLELNASDLDSLRHRLSQKQLLAHDYDHIGKIIDLVVYLRLLVEKRKAGLKKLLRMLFGLKTEMIRPKRTPSPIDKKDSSGNPCPPKKGRNGRHDYPGAKKVSCNHDQLKPGDICPECTKAKLRKVEPGVAYGWNGSSPIGLTIYFLQRLICDLCKASFMASVPDDANIKTVDDSADEYKTARCDANAAANAMVVLMRFQYGVPNYRLAGIQGNAGIPLPESTQNQMGMQVYAGGVYIFEAFIHIAAKGNLFHNDDTKMRILDVLITSRKEAKKQKDKKIRISTRTSVIVAETDEKQTVVLYFTGSAVAGENLAWVLSHRPNDLSSPKLVCDGSKQNLPKGHDVVLSHCLGHARRKFFDLNEKGYELGEVLSLFGQIYVVDMQAKIEGMNDNERLLLHQKHSTSTTNKLKKWMEDTIKEKKVETNSDLGGAIEYCLERWSELTLFLRVPGIPITNDIAEQMLKIPVVRHRKASLHYKTQDGAIRGDISMSLIATCEKNQKNPLDYFTKIQMYRSDVIKHPELWFPWNYQQRIAFLTSGAGPPFDE